MEKQQRIEYLVSKLNEASEAYYGGKDEALSNYEWDTMFDELTALEEETGYILPNSPTHTVSTAESDGIEGGVKEVHEYPALSLQKSKDVQKIMKWAGGREVWCGLKLDGCTCVATYDDAGDGSGDSVLTKLLTRGNGIVGTNITYHAASIQHLPLRIKDGGHVVVRGEVLITNEDFETINATLPDDEEEYANARNLAAGTLTLDASKTNEVKERNLQFIAFSLVHIDRKCNSWGERMNYLDARGFTTVPRKICKAPLEEEVAYWTKKVEDREVIYPVDGLVVTFEDWSYASSGGNTGHHSRNGGFAFKWADEPADTVLTNIDWSCAVGSITPVAVFQPVELEGTTVTRASLCNISEMERLGIGANGKTKIRVIKANKIIPKCIEVLEKEGTFDIPEHCPVCGAQTEIRISPKSGTKVLHCTNPGCPAKHLKKFVRAVSKDALDIDGLSVKTLQTFINKGYLKEVADLYHLDKYADEIRKMDGFGDKSWTNLWTAIQNRKVIPAEKFIYSLCIPLIGKDVAKKILNAVGYDGFFERMQAGVGFEDIKNIGPEKSKSILSWAKDSGNQASLTALLGAIEVQKAEPKVQQGGACDGLTFVITGDVHQFKNRNAFKKWVEDNGGAVAGSVSKKTAYLVNNDAASSSSKNKKAHELGIPILTEDEFIQKFGAEL